MAAYVKRKSNVCNGNVGILFRIFESCAGKTTDVRYIPTFKVNQFVSLLSATDCILKEWLRFRPVSIFYVDKGNALRYEVIFYGKWAIWWYVHHTKSVNRHSGSYIYSVVYMNFSMKLMCTVIFSTYEAISAIYTIYLKKSLQLLISRTKHILKLH